MEKPTKQFSMLFTENEYRALHNESHRRAIENGHRASIAGLIREYITPHIDALLAADDESHDAHAHVSDDAVCVPDVDTDNALGHMPDSDIDSMPDSIHESMREASTTSVASNPGLFNFTDLGN